jgi:excisionase family DNA binding protein
MITSAPPNPKRAALERATYSLAELAALLGIGSTTAYEKAQAGTLPVAPIRVGRRYLFSKSSVDRLLGVNGEGSGDAAA